MVQKEVVSGLDMLVKVAIQGLTSMFDRRANMFCTRAVRDGDTIKYEGSSYWETLNALLGLNEAYQYDLKIPFDLAAATQYHIERAQQLTEPGPAGVFLWLTARSFPEHLSPLYDKIVFTDALDRFNENREGRTRELCFLLIGLSEVRLSDGEEPAYLDELAYMARQLLFVCYGGFGVFRSVHHQSQMTKKKTRYGTFTDQAFAMYAFMRYAQAFDDPQSMEIALECAKHMTNVQGELGQWWSLYDAQTGEVARKYPVYSLNQDALAPLALLGIGERTGEDFSDEINDGILWLYRRNEIDLHLISQSLEVIWEGVHEGKKKLYAEDMVPSINILAPRDKPRSLAVAFECRPSHLGWLLFALSGYLEPGH